MLPFPHRSFRSSPDALLDCQGCHIQPALHYATCFQKGCSDIFVHTSEGGLDLDGCVSVQFLSVCVWLCQALRDLELSHRLALGWLASGGVGCLLPLVPWFSHPWLWKLGPRPPSSLSHTDTHMHAQTHMHTHAHRHTAKLLNLFVYLFCLLYLLIRRLLVRSSLQAK